MPITFNKNTRFLFLGDAATDCGRGNDADSIGNGYVRMIRDYLRAKDTATAPLVINRGHAGVPLANLAEQWEQEILAERPNVVSVLIDAPPPRGQTGGPNGSLGEFRAIYRQILTRLYEAVPWARLVLCEPVAAWSTAPFEADENLRPYGHALMHIAREFNAEALVPVHSALTYAQRTRPDISWVSQDQQLSSSAHTAIAHTWLDTVEISGW